MLVSNSFLRVSIPRQVCNLSDFELSYFLLNHISFVFKRKFALGIFFIIYQAKWMNHRNQNNQTLTITNMVRKNIKVCK